MVNKVNHEFDEEGPNGPFVSTEVVLVPTN